MGADLNRLYAKGKPKTDYSPTVFERSDEAIDAGYFRDPYNDYSVLAMYGLSWWSDVIPMCDTNDVLSLEKVRRLRSRLNDRTFEDNLSSFNSIESVLLTDEYRTSLRNGADLLKRYLDDCIADGDAIETSL